MKPTLPRSRPTSDSPEAQIAARGLRALVEAELVASTAWLIGLRWLAGLGVLLATWALGAVFGLAAPAGPLYAIGAGILLYNLGFYLAERRLAGQPAAVAADQYDLLAKWQVGLDWLAVTLLIHFSGGVESPAILFFIFHVIIASIFFTQPTALALALVATTLLAALVLAEYAGVLAHAPIVGFLEQPLYQNGLYVTALLVFFGSTSLIVAYLASTLHERLRQREAAVVSLSTSLQRATRQLEALNEAARVVGSTLELKQVLNRLVHSTTVAMGVQACSIRLVDPRGQLESVAAYGLSQAYLEKGPVDAHSNPLAREVLAGRLVNISDVLDTQLLQYREEVQQEGIRSILAAPLLAKSKPLGILRAYAVEPHHFGPDDETFLAAIAAQGSIAIENALAYQSVEALDAAKGQFIRTITHELRSPVSVTRSLVRTLVDGYAGPVTAQQQDILNRAGRRMEFLQKLIDDLLDLTAGKLDLMAREHFEPVSLGAVLGRVAGRFEVSAREKKVSLECRDEAGQPVWVLGTEERLDRVFNNLISNAVKYTPPGGRIGVTLACEEGWARVTVEDTGIGISAEAMPHLFEEFYRAPNAKAIEQEGTGLGLAIIKDTLTRLGGRVSVDSTLGAGTRFVVTLPEAAGAARE